MTKLVHLAKRFFGSLFATPLRAVDQQWVAQWLSDDELKIWGLLSRADQRHHFDVSEAVWRRLKTDRVRCSDERSVVAAALLHDCGKIASGYGTFGRVWATVVWTFVTLDKTGEWRKNAKRARLAAYKLHPQIGSDMLEEIGSTWLVSTWAREHHLDSQLWSIEPEIAQILSDCDND